MEREQELEWLEAQKIVFSEDLVAAAEKQLQFLAAVDRRRFLYDGPLLERAIHRYKTYWLPLLARHTESGAPDGSLLVPLDCEWIWHCHRLNPIQYKKDCEKLYGRVLDNKNVQSTVEDKLGHQTAEVWSMFCPDEPFELEPGSYSAETNIIKHTDTVNSITYDLVSAVNRQSSFYYQVCRPIMHDKRFLDGSVARYKGFLRLIKRCSEMPMAYFCVPTYDIDLIWHSHQLQPISYQRDTMELLGKVLEHDDTDSDRSKGKKLDTGFSGTTKMWEDAYGFRYWRAGAMHRGVVPALLESTPHLSIYNRTQLLGFHRPETSLPLKKTMVVEVLLEIVGIKNLPASLKGNVFVTFSKKKPDVFLNGTCELTIFSETGKKRGAGFECEPVGDLVLAVMTKSEPAETIGNISISLEERMDPNAELSLLEWFELKTYNRNANSKPIYLHVAASFTTPVPAPHVFEMLKFHPFSMYACNFPFPNVSQHIRSWTRVIDRHGSDIIRLQMRKLQKTGGNKHPIWKPSIFGMMGLSKNSYLLAEYADNTWFFKDSDLSLRIEQKASQEGHIVELKSSGQLKLIPGRKLDYQPGNVEPDNADEFMTVVEFTAENPYGKAIALLDMKSALVKVSEDWFALPALLIAFILSHLLKKGGSFTLAPSMENLKEKGGSFTLAPSMENVKVTPCLEEAGVTDSSSAPGMLAAEVNLKSGGSCGGCGAGGCGDGFTAAKGGGCGGGCVSGCSADVNTNGGKASGG